MKYGNKDVSAVKYTGLGVDKKAYSNSPVIKILNKSGVVMWESAWYINVALRATAGTTKSTKYPNCYFAKGTLLLEAYLVHVQLSVPEYATHDWSYNKATGLLTYTLYSEKPSVTVGSLVYCYRYLKSFEFAPEVTVYTVKVTEENHYSEFRFITKNDNSSPMYCRLIAKNENGATIYTNEVVIASGNTSNNYVGLVAVELTLTATFYAIGYKDSTTTKYIYPYL